MLKPRFPYTQQQARTLWYVTFRTPRSDRRYRRRCSTCRKCLARDRKSSYCKPCQAERMRKQRIWEHEKKLRERRGVWRDSINLEVLKEDDWWVYWIEPDRAEFLDWIRKKYAYAFVSNS